MWDDLMISTCFLHVFMFAFDVFDAFDAQTRGVQGECHRAKSFKTSEHYQLPSTCCKAHSGIETSESGPHVSVTTVTAM